MACICVLNYILIGWGWFTVLHRFCDFSHCEAYDATVFLTPPSFGICLFIFKRFYVFVERGEGREKERDRNINVCLPLARPLLGTWPETQAWALTGNQTGDPSVYRPVLSPLSHTTQGLFVLSYDWHRTLCKLKCWPRSKRAFQSERNKHLSDINKKIILDPWIRAKAQRVLWLGDPGKRY